MHTYKTLTRIGREVLSRFPEIAAGIIATLPENQVQDLTLIDDYFTRYCKAIGLPEHQVRGRLYKSSLIENQKIFLAAMRVKYGSQYLFKKTVTATLDQRPAAIWRMLKEVDFRYKKDYTFKASVDSILLTLQK